MSLLRVFGGNIIGAFAGKRIYFHVAAIVATYVIVVSGFDWYWFTHTRGAELQRFLRVGIGLGSILPALVPFTLYIFGRTRGSEYLKTASLAVLEAAVIGSLISSTYKAFTGRIQPDRFNPLVDSSHQFQFGFLRHGVFWGWPSSHTTIAFAMAVTLMCLFPKHKVVVYGALLYAFYVGFGVSTNIHWFSEFVAGALIGTAIGFSVGKTFRK
jgi:membrane-associated phospholipid phosphatase